MTDASQKNARNLEVFDRGRVAQNRNRAVAQLDQYDFLLKRASSDLISRLDDISRSFPTVLDLGSHHGLMSEALDQHSSIGQIFALERAGSLARQTRHRGIPTIQGDEETLPFKDGSFDLISSALSLHWINDLPGALIQIRKALKPDGLFLGCLFAAGTLSELRTSLIEAESSLTAGISPRVSPLASLQDLAGLLQRSGFALPVADIDHITVRYQHPMSLLADLRGSGEQAAFASKPGQERRPLSRRMLQRTCEVYQDRFSDPDGKVRASFNIAWLSGWAPSDNQPKPLKPGSGKVSLAAAVRQNARRSE
ncbi:MAG: methyltransferase domain-containing protein [Henriciella sp.]